MPLSHDHVTATVSVTGLALGCYNAETQNYEVGLLRHNRHIVTIEVTKQLEGGRHSWLKFQLDAMHRIFIDTENGILPLDPFYRDGETFDRTDTTHDHEDFRWVVDFEKELNNNNEVVLKHTNDPVTEMYVSKPLLYADQKNFALDNYLLLNKGAGGSEPPTLFGLFAEGVKADLKCKDGGAVILRVEGPQGFQVYLPHGAGTPHEIKIENICSPQDVSEEQPTDFTLYYNLITATNGTQYDVLPVNGEVEGEGAVCNGSFLGVRGNMFPLPSI